MQILKVIFIILEVVLLFNLLIFVHELGHFLAARWRGLKIERFAIWFGKPIWKRTYNGVEYCLGWIPAGGYVALPQMAPMEMLEGEAKETQVPTPTISSLDKIIVALAGPVFSFGLAIFFACVVYFVGRPVNEAETTTTIGYVEKQSPADASGLKPGDVILEVDGQKVEKFRGMGRSVQWQIISRTNESGTVAIKVQRGDEVLTFNPKPVRRESTWSQRRNLSEVGFEPAGIAVVDSVHPDGPAASAGLKSGDQVVGVAGNPVYHRAQVGQFIEANPGLAVPLKIKRDQEELSISVMPQKPTQPADFKPMLGITWGEGRWTLAHPSPIEQVRDSVQSMISTFAALFNQKSEVGAQHLSGAVKIMHIYYQLFDSERGWRLALWFSVLINVNLAILNMLPLPVLDGGHITVAIIESIARRQVPRRVIEAVNTACAIALMVFMLYVTFFDVQDVFKRAPKRPDIQFAPQPTATSNAGAVKP